MTLNEHFLAEARNNRWANHRLHKACLALQPGEFTAPRTSFFPSIAATLNHIQVVDLYYLDALTEGGRGAAIWREWRDFEDPAALAAAQAQVDQALIAFCAGLVSGDAERDVATDREEHGIVQERIGGILAHLFQHQIHHRGQVHAMLAGTSVRPPQLDEFFIVYDRADDIAAALGEGIGLGPRR